MKEKTGVMPTLKAAASELGSRGNQGAVGSITHQMKEKTGEMPTLMAAAFELGSRGNQGAVGSVANQMKEKTGDMLTLKAAAFELGSRGNQGAVGSSANQMKEKTGEMPTLMAAASELGSRGNQGALEAIILRTGIALKEAAGEKGRRAQDSRRIGTRGSYATENCKNAMKYADGLCNPCHNRVPEKLKAEFCIGIGGRVCGREIYRGNQCTKCYYDPDEKKTREAKKAAKPKCTIDGCGRSELRSYGLCEKHYKERNEEAKAEMKVPTDGNFGY
jgi:hypothetical protein